MVRTSALHVLLRASSLEVVRILLAVHERKRHGTNGGRQVHRTTRYPMAPLNGIRDDDFNQYIRKVLTVWPRYVSALYGSYTKPRVDFIGKTERLADDLIIVLDRLGLKYDEQFIRNYKKQNVSATPESAAVWDDDVRRLATTLEMPALMQYDYLDGDAAPDGVRIPAACTRRCTDLDEVLSHAAFGSSSD